jgi:hypothetical protein
MPLRLLELVYEGGDVLDVALARQRRILKSELGDEFQSVDLRRLPLLDRERLLRKLGGTQPENLLLRGLSRLEETMEFFPKSQLLLDYLARREALRRGELMRWVHKTKRVYCYSDMAERASRQAGCGKISRFPGPLLPNLSDEREPRDRPVVGVLELGDGAGDVLIRLKKLRAQNRWDFDIAATRKMAGVERCDSEFEVGEAADLLLGPLDAPDLGGPHEPGMLALSLRKALCTSSNSALYSLPVFPTGGYIPAERYDTGTYAAAFGVYTRNPTKYDTAFDKITLAPDAVPRDILSRV